MVSCSVSVGFYDFFVLTCLCLLSNLLTNQILFSTVPTCVTAWNGDPFSGHPAARDHKADVPREGAGPGVLPHRHVRRHRLRGWHCHHLRGSSWRRAKERLRVGQYARYEFSKLHLYACSIWNLNMYWCTLQSRSN